MRGIIEFLLYLLLLWGAALLAFRVKTLSLESPLLLFVVMLGVGFALALIGKRWGRGMLMLAIPLAVVLAHLSAQRLWPPEEQYDRAQAYRLMPEGDRAEGTSSPEGDLLYGPDDERHNAPDFRVQNLDLPLMCSEDSGTSVEIKVLSGMDMCPVACGLDGIGDMVFTPGEESQMMFVSSPDAGMVYRLEKQTSHSAPSGPSGSGCDKWNKDVFTSALDRPMGLGIHDGSLYVATRTAVVRLDISAPEASRQIDIETVTDDLPPANNTEHRALTVAADGTVYLSLGAGDAETQNLEWQRAGVLRIPPEGEGELFATGLHHVRALAYHPQSRELWGVEDSPETLGLNPPADELNVIKQGRDYGWPFCYGNRVPDKDLGTRTICQSTEVPLALLSPHSSPAGLAFGADLNAPDRYRSMLYVALKGRADDIQRRGFRILGLPMDAQGDLTGWGVEVVSGLATSTKIYAQPSSLAVAADGGLYVGDTHSGTVYRIAFPPPKDQSPGSSEDKSATTAHKHEQG